MGNGTEKVILIFYIVPSAFITVPNYLVLNVEYVNILHIWSDKIKFFYK